VKVKTNKTKSTTLNKSVINKLKDQNLIDDSVLVCLNNLTLEDVIAIKLELSANLLNNRPFGFDMWRKSGYIIKEAFLRFAISTTNSKKNAARFLGLPYNEFVKVLKKFPDVESYFKEDVESL